MPRRASARTVAAPCLVPAFGASGVTPRRERVYVRKMLVGRLAGLPRKGTGLEPHTRIRREIMKRMNHRLRSTLWTGLVAAALLVPGLAHGVGLTVEGFYGLTRPPDNSIDNALDDGNIFDDSLQLAGGDVLIRFGMLQLGAIADVNWGERTATQTALGALAGVALPLGPARLDLMGEIGGQRYGNLAENREVVTSSTREQWLAYVGLRPGIAFKVGTLGPGLQIGVWTFARWDLQKEDVRVSLAGGGEGDYELGGVTLGATLRVGVDF